MSCLLGSDLVCTGVTCYVTTITYNNTNNIIKKKYIIFCGVTIITFYNKHYKNSNKLHIFMHQRSSEFSIFQFYIIYLYISLCSVCNTMYLLPLLSFACNTTRALLLFNCTQYNKCVSYIGSAWPCLSLLSLQQLMIDITVLTLIGSDTPSLSDSSHVKRLICGD